MDSLVQLVVLSTLIRWIVSPGLQTTGARGYVDGWDVPVVAAVERGGCCTGLKIRNYWRFDCI